MKRRRDAKKPKGSSSVDSQIVVLDKFVLMPGATTYMQTRTPKVGKREHRTEKRFLALQVGTTRKDHPHEVRFDPGPSRFRFPGLVIRMGANMADELREATRVLVRYGEDEQVEEVMNLKDEIEPGVLDSVLEQATEVFGDSSYAAEWLQASIPSLDAKPPLLHLRSGAGVKRVRDTLGMIRYGMF